MDSRKGAITFALVLVGACLAVYAGSLRVPFIFDDLTSIPENPHIRSLWPLSRALTAPDYTTIAGRPLACLSLAVNYALGGLNVFGYHAVNLALHVGCALALWALLGLTFASPRMGRGGTATRKASPPRRRSCGRSIRWPPRPWCTWCSERSSSRRVSTC